MSSKPESERPTLVAIEFFHITNVSGYAFATDSDGEDHFIVNLSPVVIRTIIKLGESYEAFVSHKRFSSKDSFEEFAKTHGVLCKHIFDWEAMAKATE